MNYKPYLLGLLVLAACGKKQSPLNSGDGILGLASPVQLADDSTQIILEDYFLSPDSITALSPPEGMQIRPSEGNKSAWLIHTGPHPVLSTLGIEHAGKNYDLLLRRSRKQTVVFSYQSEDQGTKQVQLVGDMNNWNPNNTPLEKVNGRWEVRLRLEPGFYPYQLVVDGNWMLDPGNSNTRDNGIGGRNSLLEVATPPADSLPRLHSIGFTNKEVVIGNSGKAGELVAFWQNVRLPADYIQTTDSSYTVQLPAEAKNPERSHLRLYAHNSLGESNDLFIPLQKGEVVTEASQLRPDDFHAQRMYFVMVDRFHNGNAANDKPLDHPEVHPKANYWGGDLRGITEKIKSGFFKELGINTLWISPITQNPEGPYREWPAPHRMYSGYHGYWPISSSLVDHRFGTSEELKELLRIANDNGIRILLDYVANHVHQEHPLMQQKPEWKTQLDLPDGRKNIRIWDEHRLTTWFDTFMPSLDLEKPEVIEAMTDSALFWMEQYGFAGFRHDATKHIPEAFWRRLTQKIKERVVRGQGRSVYQIGETFGSRQLIGSYIGSGMIDGQFDFNLYFDARSAFADSTTSFKSLSQSLEESFRYYGYHHLMGNISGNHDLPRFISFASGALRFDEDDREAGWNRQVEIKDPVGYAKLQQLLTFISTIPGVPVVYAGDDIGMVGAGDPDNRRPMKFDNWTDNEASTRYRLTQVLEMRKNSMALNYGETDILLSTTTQLAYLRSYFGEAVLVCFNKSNSEATLNIPIPAHLRKGEVMGQMGHPVAMDRERMIITTLPANSYEIITFR